MSYERDAQEILNNNLFQKIVGELSLEGYQSWMSSETVEEREKLFFEAKGLNTMYATIKAEVEKYLPNEETEKVVKGA